MFSVKTDTLYVYSRRKIGGEFLSDSRRRHLTWKYDSSFGEIRSCFLAFPLAFSPCRWNIQAGVDRSSNRLVLCFSVGRSESKLVD